MENGLTPRQWALKRFLEDNYIPGRFWSIEEICECVYMPNGIRAYQYNTNPRIHDKCVALSNDVREINWSVIEGYKILVKDKKGGVKICETRKEFEEWRENELKPLDRKWKYLNTLVWKKNEDETVPLFKKSLAPNDAFEPISVFYHDDEGFIVK